MHLKFRGLEPRLHVEHRAGRSAAGRLRAGRADAGGADAVPRSERGSERSEGYGDESTFTGWQCQVCVQHEGEAAVRRHARRPRRVLRRTPTSDVSEIVYRIKATNVGNYAVPPAYGEAMYDRSVVGRSAAGKTGGVEAVNGWPRSARVAQRRLLCRLLSLATCVSGRSVVIASAPRRSRSPARIPSSTAVFDRTGPAAATDARERSSSIDCGRRSKTSRRSSSTRCCCTRTSTSIVISASIPPRSCARRCRPTPAVRASAVRRSRCSSRG